MDYGLIDHLRTPATPLTKATQGILEALKSSILEVREPESDMTMSADRSWDGFVMMEMPGQAWSS
jgi:hypothetical protein